MSENQLCWECKKACGKCPWSFEFKPIPGWVATTEPNGSYEIKECPLFERDDKIQVTVNVLRKILRLSHCHFLYRWSTSEIKEAFRQKGYELFIEKPLFENETTRYYIRKINK